MLNGPRAIEAIDLKLPKFIFQNLQTPTSLSDQCVQNRFTSMASQDENEHRLPLYKNENDLYNDELYTEDPEDNNQLRIFPRRNKSYFDRIKNVLYD